MGGQEGVKDKKAQKGVSSLLGEKDGGWGGEWRRKRWRRAGLGGGGG